MIIDFNKVLVDQDKARASNDAASRRRIARNLLVDWMETYSDLGADFIDEEFKHVRSLFLSNASPSS